MRLPRQSSILTFGLAAIATAEAQFLVGELSFGYTGRYVLILSLVMSRLASISLWGELTRHHNATTATAQIKYM